MRAGVKRCSYVSRKSPRNPSAFIRSSILSSPYTALSSLFFCWVALSTNSIVSGAFAGSQLCHPSVCNLRMFANPTAGAQSPSGISHDTLRAIHYPIELRPPPLLSDWSGGRDSYSVEKFAYNSSLAFQCGGQVRPIFPDSQTHTKEAKSTHRENHKSPPPAHIVGFLFSRLSPGCDPLTHHTPWFHGSLVLSLLISHMYIYLDMHRFPPPLSHR